MSELYAERDIENLETYDEHMDELLAGRHVFGNTDIAAELAHRDSVIEKQASEIDSLKVEIKRLGDQTMFIINEM